MKYDKQDRQGKAAFNERTPHPTQQQAPAARSPGGPQRKTGQGIKPAYHRLDLKSRQHILRVIQHYSSRNIGTTQLENAKKVETKNTTSTTIMSC
jgi:hypothetical protein